MALSTARVADPAGEDAGGVQRQRTAGRWCRGSPAPRGSRRSRGPRAGSAQPAVRTPGPLVGQGAVDLRGEAGGVDAEPALDLDAGTCAAPRGRSARSRRGRPAAGPCPAGRPPARRAGWWWAWRSPAEWAGWSAGPTAPVRRRSRSRSATALRAPVQPADAPVSATRPAPPASRPVAPSSPRPRRVNTAPACHVRAGQPRSTGRVRADGGGKDRRVERRPHRERHGQAEATRPRSSRARARSTWAAPPATRTCEAEGKADQASGNLKQAGEKVKDVFK